MAERPKLWFCFPYRGVGGVSLLFLRVGEELARRKLAEVTFVDYADGYMARHHDPALTRLAAYEDDGIVAIPDDAILILQSMSPWSIYPALRPAPLTRLLFWNCHPYNLVPTLPCARALSQRPVPGRILRATILAGFRARSRRFARLLLAKRSLIFMDEPNVRVTRDALGVAVADPVMVPIPAVEAPARIPRGVGSPLRVLWIGRIVDFKSPILLRALRELNALAGRSGRAIAVDILGGGDREAQLRRETAGLDALKIAWLGERSPRELDALLADADLLMAMGTSALEGARLGVPTLLLDFSYGPVGPDYDFGWLHERGGFALGDEASLRRGGEGSMELRLTELEAAPHALGAAARRHFERFHALSAVAVALNTAAQQAGCRWEDLRDAGLLGRGHLYAVFAAIRKRYRRK